MTSRPVPQARVVAHVSGRVQGVGFRWWTSYRAADLGLTGSAVNLPDGRVAIDVEGSREGCQELLSDLRPGVAPGRVDTVDVVWSTPRGARGFSLG